MRIAGNGDHGVGRPAEADAVAGPDVTGQDGPRRREGEELLSRANPNASQAAQEQRPLDDAVVAIVVRLAGGQEPEGLGAEDEHELLPRAGRPGGGDGDPQTAAGDGDEL